MFVIVIEWPVIKVGKGNEREKEMKKRKKIERDEKNRIH